MNIGDIYLEKITNQYYNYKIQEKKNQDTSLIILTAVFYTYDSQDFQNVSNDLQTLKPF